MQYRGRSNWGRGLFAAGLVSVATVFTLGFVPTGAAAPAAGSGWSASTYFDQPGGFQSVSCLSDSFCAAQGKGGLAVTYNGSTWSGFTGVDGGNMSWPVSCGSSSFCLAPGLGAYVAYNGTSWVTHDLPWFSATWDPSCVVGSTTCIGIGGPDPGDWAIYSNGGWTQEMKGNGQPQQLDTYHLERISCASLSFCAVLDSGYHALIYSGTTWTPPASLSGSSAFGPDAVSCAPGSAFCLAVGASGLNGYSWTYNGGSWSSTTTLPNEPLEAVSCASPTFCMAVERGSVLVYNGSSWGAPTVVDTVNADSLNDVSCPSPSFCAAVGGGGQSDTFIYHASAASPPPTATTTTTTTTTTPTTPAPKPKTVTVILAVKGKGTISGGGIECPGSCRLTLAAHERVTLKAKPASGYSLDSWSDLLCESSAFSKLNFNAPASCTFTAKFDDGVPEIVSPKGSMDVASVGAAIHVGATFKKKG